jgi:hypothetical protein
LLSVLAYTTPDCEYFGIKKQDLELKTRLDSEQAHNLQHHAWLHLQHHAWLHLHLRSGPARKGGGTET